MYQIAIFIKYCPAWINLHAKLINQFARSVRQYRQLWVICLDASIPMTKLAIVFFIQMTWAYHSNNIQISKFRICTPFFCFLQRAQTQRTPACPKLYQSWLVRVYHCCACVTQAFRQLRQRLHLLEHTGRQHVTGARHPAVLLTDFSTTTRVIIRAAHLTTSNQYTRTQYCRDTKGTDIFKPTRWASCEYTGTFFVITLTNFFMWHCVSFLRILAIIISCGDIVAYGLITLLDKIKTGIC